MKRLIAALAMTVAGTAMANGTYDGLYQDTNNPKSFLLVQQNGGTILAGAYYAVKSTGVNFTYLNGIVVAPSELHMWDAFMGPIQGNTATVSGEVVNGMCAAKFAVTFGDQTVTAKLVEIQPTTAGATAQTQCSLAMPVGYTMNVKRVF